MIYMEVPVPPEHVGVWYGHQITLWVPQKEFQILTEHLDTTFGVDATQVYHPDTINLYFFHPSIVGFQRLADAVRFKLTWEETPLPKIHTSAHRWTRQSVAIPPRYLPQKIQMLGNHTPGIEPPMHISPSKFQKTRPGD
jgi:hypothetical protein